MNDFTQEVSTETEIFIDVCGKCFALIPRCKTLKEYDV